MTFFNVTISHDDRTLCRWYMDKRRTNLLKLWAEMLARVDDADVNDLIDNINFDLAKHIVASLEEYGK